MQTQRTYDTFIPTCMRRHLTKWTRPCFRCVDVCVLYSKVQVWIDLWSFGRWIQKKGDECARNAYAERGKTIQMYFFDLCSAVRAQVSFRNTLVSAERHMRWYNFLMNYCGFDLLHEPLLRPCIMPHSNTIDRNNVVRFRRRKMRNALPYCVAYCTLSEWLSLTSGATSVFLLSIGMVHTGYTLERLMHVSIMKKQLKITGMEVIS